MDLFSLKIIKEFVLKNKTGPSKCFGQNFLIDKNVLEKIIATADIKSTDVILEIGPGVGTLTKELATNAKKVIAVEKDTAMVKILKETLKDFKNIEVVEADILKTDIQRLLPNAYKVVANIPYYITAPIIRLLLEADNQPKEIILMVQKEVAQRICAKPGEMSLLAVSAQFYATVKIVSYVSKNCFWPAPKVDSAIIKITPHRNVGRRTSHISVDLFFKIVKAGFSQPRKQLAGNLSKALKIDKEKTALWLKKNNILPTQRAETLSINDWQNLTNTL